MFRIAKKTALSISAVLLLGATLAQADATPYPDEGNSEASGLAMAADLVVARPLGLIASVLGTGIFIVGLPIEAISGDVSGPARRLIVEPVKFTFSRPLGQINK